jgi:hypothetical protein
MYIYKGEISMLMLRRNENMGSVVNRAWYADWHKHVAAQNDYYIKSSEQIDRHVAWGLDKWEEVYTWGHVDGFAHATSRATAGNVSIIIHYSDGSIGMYCSTVHTSGFLMYCGGKTLDTHKHEELYWRTLYELLSNNTALINHIEYRYIG